MSADIESTLVFDVDDRFGRDDPRELIAEGIHEQEDGDRSMRTIYYLEHEQRLLVRSYYRFAGERRNQVSASEWTVTDGQVEYNGQSLEDFIEDHFHADPHAALGEEYDSMVQTEEVER